jgi:phenylpropionate dioxygenase-like ring-hydroxylating dioxygenase large terminal subunit
MYLRNAWYVAAWSTEIEDAPVRRVILGEPVVFYRRTDRSIAALEDACPHRKLPLSMGVVTGDNLRCGYHGLEFGSDGKCVAAPGATRLPPNACVKGYPVAERYGLVWIWTGVPEEANPDDIPHVAHYGDPAWGINRGPAMDVNCNYLYMTDNLLDPSHVTYVHKTSLGNTATADVPVKMSVLDNGVVASRWILDHELAPFFQPYVGFTGHADRLQHYEVRYPSHAVISDIIAPANSGAPQGQLHPSVFLLDSYNFVTPVTERTCRYFWFQVRNFRPDCAETDRALTSDFISAFNEDLVILSAVDEGMTNKRTPNTDIVTDAAPLRFRRTLQKMIDAEHASPCVVA